MRGLWIGSAALVGTFFATIASLDAQASIQCGGQEATIVGTSNDDVLTGTDEADVIAALGGDDVVYGLAGADVICGSHGHDRLIGGDGADRIFAFNGSDRVEGGPGPDLIFGGRGADTLLGDAGRDVLKGGPGFDTLIGGAQRDTLLGGLHRDQLFGGTELDTCYSPGDQLSECERGGGQVQGPSLSTEYANEMLRLINVERAKVPELDPLDRSLELDSYARDWAVVMSDVPLVDGGLADGQHHSPVFSGSDVEFRDLPTQVEWTRAYENVGYSTVGTDELISSVMERLFYSPGGAGFMSSDGHRCNILETAATQVGVGVHIDASGDVWVVQVLWGTSSPVPEAIESCRAVVGR